MTQALATNDLIKVQLWSVDIEQASVNTFHYRVTGVGSPTATLEDFLAGWITAVNSDYKDLLNVNTDFRGAVAQIVFPLPLMVAVTSVTGAGAGTGGATTGPRQTAGLLSWRTPFAGSAGRGRTYIPFPAAEDMDTDGTPTPAYVTRLGNFSSALLAFQNVSSGGRTASVELIIKAQNSSAFKTVTLVIDNKKWATMKKRGSYGRPNTSPV